MKLQIAKAGLIKPGDVVVFRNRYMTGSPFETDNPVDIERVERRKDKFSGKDLTTFYSGGEPVKQLFSETMILKFDQ